MDDESKITVDVIDALTYKSPDYTDDARKSAIENFQRYKELKKYNEGGAADVGEIMAGFPKVNFRHYVAPSQGLSIASALDGTNSTCTFPMQLLGRQDGANSIKLGEGYMNKKMMEWMDSPELQRQNPNMNDYVV